MHAVYWVIYGTVILFGVTVVAAFVWAIRTHQFQKFQQGAVSIFDPDEPVGEMTDGFPGESGPPPEVLDCDQDELSKLDPPDPTVKGTSIRHE
ncbi:hypothetical protein Pan216_17290 [Planctomycetes bacterium Pan216]|uniref:Uncharacterized protein n=1 Tax=Kolteria novifilia TaxID=2527975 RepID=A0A518B1T0_9BACT|nr:hypothetical protein Pan216_17290 [Planctomycetes bacterium Pan216]